MRAIALEVIVRRFGDGTAGRDLFALGFRHNGVVGVLCLPELCPTRSTQDVTGRH